VIIDVKVPESSQKADNRNNDGMTAATNKVVRWYNLIQP
jgi:hypothetical protein